MRIINLVFLIGCCLLLGSCNKATPINSNVSTKDGLNSENNTLNDSRPSEENVGIPGYILECDEQLVNNNIVNINCGVQEQTGELLDFTNEAELLQVSIESPYESAFRILPESDPFHPIHLELDTNLSNGVDKSIIYANTILNVSFKIIAYNQTKKINSSMNSSIKNSEPVLFKYWRINVESVEANLLGSPTVCINNLVFYENNVPLNSRVDVNQNELFGNYAVASTSSSQPLPEHPTSEALDNNDEIFWESDFNLFAGESPFDAVVDVWFQIEFLNDLVDISGIEIFSQTPIYPIGECIPDQIQITASQDAINWVVIQGVNFETPSTLESIFISLK